MSQSQQALGSLWRGSLFATSNCVQRWTSVGLNQTTMTLLLLLLLKHESSADADDDMQREANEPLPVYCAGQSPGTVPRHVRICRKQHAIVTNRCKFMPNWVTVHLRPALLHQSLPFKSTELHDLNHWVVLLMKLFIFGVNLVILIKIIWLYICGASYFIVIFILFGSLSSLCVGLCLCFLLYFAANIWPNKLCMHCSWNHEIAACRYSALADYP